MTSNELKELVKQHFSLTEAPTKQSFGEIMDENKVFTILFPGTSLQVGDEVRVRTADGQELTAPDGEHRLEDGAVIRVEDGKVVEYTSEAEIEEREGEELAIDGEVEQPASIEGVEVEKEGDKVMTAKMAGDTEEVIEDTMEEEVPSAVQDVVEAVIEAVKEEVQAMKAELAEMKRKMAELEDAPATEKAMPEMMKSDKTIKPTADVFNKTRFDIVMERFSKK